MRGRLSVRNLQGYPTPPTPIPPPTPMGCNSWAVETKSPARLPRPRRCSAGIRAARAGTGFRAIGDLRVTSNIAAPRDAAFNTFPIYVRGEDNRLYTRASPDTGVWNAANGVSLTSDPAASTGAVYVRGTDNAVYAAEVFNDGQNNNIRAFARVNGPVTGNPAAFNLAPNGGATQYLLARQPNDALAFDVKVGFNGNVTPFDGYAPIPGPAVG